MLLTIIFSQKKTPNWENILEIIPNSIISYADPNIEEDFIFKDKILTIKCHNTYDFLQFKTYFTYQAILLIPDFNNITHIYKLNDNVNLKKYYYPSLTEIENKHYYGKKINKKNNIEKYNREWHFKKCPIYSYWHNKKYEGNFIPWIDGNIGYIISRHAIQIIARVCVSEIKKHIYDDLMISLILYDEGILPDLI